MKKIVFLLNQLTASFWLVPVLIVGFAIALSVVLVSIDSAIDIPQDSWFRFFLVNSSNSARSILSTISGAMIGVAGTVFSVTLVALTLASSQFGSRLIKNFMYVRLNQVVLGSYIATYLYCLLVLNAVKDGDAYTLIPSISVFVAILAAIANIILLIVFIHQIAESIQADNVISNISNHIYKQVDTLFPEKLGDELQDEDTIDEGKAMSSYTNSISLKSPKSGYLQHIDSNAMLDIVAHKDSLFKMKYRPGNFVVKNEVMGVLYANKAWDREDIEKLLKQFVIGQTKTPQQDLEYSVHQMVEIAVRALSPGINDPYTAIACIDNLTATLCNLTDAKFPSKYRFDEKGNLRVIANVIDFDGVLNAAFNQIRQFSAGSPAVIIRLMEALITIEGFAKTEHHKQLVVKHAEMVLSTGKRTIKDENDIDDLLERAEKIVTIT